ncbi:hypothetical protein [Pseudomonas oryzihabitans]|uniref:Uncharacterized protein n=1 Tax=Pseudomonas oryzihabitans TaxID=47885 RepID=A0AAJ2BG15_9PSED|nr:hypothetical protein [Pseudomonas psychrotolerans]MDR6233568.1 hypothetical protein [Pseudomonas psychrotolerans]MDR6357389.1 hypothetical protein [Pseudomonas psychrotolerans]
MSNLADSDFFTQLGKPPSHAYSFLWADYAELICLTSPDGFYGQGQIVDLTTEQEELLTDSENCDDEDLEALEDDAARFIQISEDVSRRWADISQRLNSRQLTMTGFWPFVFEGGVLYSRFDAENNNHVFYVALLLCSSLRYLQGKKKKVVTASLEEIGYVIFKSLMPSGWHVKPFGAHQRISEGYTGKLEDKFRALAGDISARFYEDRGFDPSDTGDGGLDVVAWHPIGGDGRGNIPVAFAQCGCSPTDWEHKQFEASPLNIEATLVPQHSAANFYIMPHDLKALNGSWDRGSNVGRVILVDRYRILKLAEQYGFHHEIRSGCEHVIEALAAATAAA